MCPKFTIFGEFNPSSFMKLNDNKSKNKSFGTLSHSFLSDKDLETTKESIPVMMERLIPLGDYLRKYIIKQWLGI